MLAAFAYGLGAPGVGKILLLLFAGGMLLIVAAVIELLLDPVRRKQLWDQ